MTASATVNTHLHELTALLIELREAHPGAGPLADAIEGTCFAIACAIRELPCLEPSGSDEQ